MTTDSEESKEDRKKMLNKELDDFIIENGTTLLGMLEVCSPGLKDSDGGKEWWDGKKRHFLLMGMLRKNMLDEMAEFVETYNVKEDIYLSVLSIIVGECVVKGMFSQEEFYDYVGHAMTSFQMEDRTKR